MKIVAIFLIAVAVADSIPLLEQQRYNEYLLRNAKDNNKKEARAPLDILGGNTFGAAKRSEMMSSEEDNDLETRQLMETLKAYIQKYHQDGATGINHIKLYKPSMDMDIKMKELPFSPKSNEDFFYKMNRFSGYKN